MGIDLTDDRTITVVKSPYLINLSGDVEREDQEFVAHTIEFLSKQPYKYHKFEAIQVHVTGSETDSKRPMIINDDDDDDRDYDEKDDKDNE